ncbi:hypothetical protein N866_06285 [Actinotalea ferrariae CF5-4]|uniref:Uncharacterized protein n=1 Tax=Actinotalea ferrariae CF5-4 TaxID=948458 RepID=A0A021VNE6_9CELL|nr:hypothetical protein [Actinotalea ferrariae]EYR62676.1 hypothetical protein N866_06285 [Actinotalea ferrariae CF5-4]
MADDDARDRTEPDRTEPDRADQPYLAATDGADGPGPTSTTPRTTDHHEELTMDQGTTGTTRPEGATTSTGRTTTTSTSTGTPRHDDAPWSVPAAAAPSGATALPTTRPIARGVRVGTVVWGVVVIVAGAMLAAAAAGLVLDVQLAVIATVALAGVGLVVGSLVSAGRRRTREV